MKTKYAHLKQEKRCPRCGEIKPRSEYVKCKNRPGGWSSHCKSCIAEQARERYQKDKAKSSCNIGSNLSHRAKSLGIKYTFENSKKQWGVYRDIIIYNCPKCGKIIKTTRKEALQNDFLCSDCSMKEYQENLSNLVMSHLPIAENKTISDVSKNVDHNCNCFDKPSDNTLKQNKSSNKDVYLKIIVVHKLEDHESKPNSKIKTWFKKLFHLN